MYRAHVPETPSEGIFRIYVPGIGTLFPEIGDRGKGIIIDTHNAMGAVGQARLDWALKEVQQIIAQAEARATNPTNKIVSITFAIFGFSRGATLARAFVRDLLKLDGGKVIGPAGALRWKQGNYPVELSFLGLWDTVASVGVPIGANNVAPVRRERAGWGNAARSALFGPAVPTLRAKDLAFGAPGADPLSGPANGHNSWADNLHIPDAVTTCVHMMAAHEIRNSFPVDSVAVKSIKPSNCKEFVYPGVHSNVGGGYRPGEGGKGKATPADSEAPDADKLLSLIPLRAMYDEALLAGVPLRKMGSKQWQDFNESDFYASPKMLADFDHYMDQVGRSGCTLGAAFLAHTRLYLAWRFHRIREKLAVRPDLQEPGPKNKTRDELGIEANEMVWAEDQRRLDDEMTTLKAQQQKLEQGRMSEQLALSRGGKSIDPKTMLPTPEGQRMAAEINAKYDPQIARIKTQLAELQARKETLPSQGSLVKQLAEYDAALLDDVNAILKEIHDKPKLRAQLRPHYRGLVETYENEFVYKRGLDKNKESDRKIIDFFDNYVHDSLSDFGLDSTLPSDPRVVYAGGSFKTKYAAVTPTEMPDTMTA
ncbi:MAG: DUF2235 domain-containing protein [Rhizobacter sp.]|nr:DUF2235 domain-containing protein [Rhizobacter sp.]